MKDLPSHWLTTSGAEVFDFITSGSRGWARYYSDVGASFIRIGNLDHGTIEIDLSTVQYVRPPPGAEADRTRLRSGDILVSITAELGMIGLVPDTLGESYINQHIALARPCQGVDARFLAWYLASEVDGKRRLQEMRRGATKAGLGLDDIRGVAFPLAPENEQKRIADKLDAVLARVDACRERLDRVPDILKHFRRAVVAAATSGELTVEWRAGQETDSNVTDQPFRWDERPLFELCEQGRVITYGVIKLGNEVADGVPCLRTSNVRWLRIDTDGMKRIAPDLSAEYARTVLRGGEVLVNVRGTLGGVAVAQAGMAGWNVSREVAVVPADNTQIDSSFLAYWVGSDASQRWLGRVKKGVAYIGINIEDLRILPIGIPPMEEQQEIVRRVETLFAYADRLETRYVAARAQVERLTPALLAKAFRGELVPQNPNDEPASVLLERIRAARAAAPAKPARGRKGQPMADAQTLGTS